MRSVLFETSGKHATLCAASPPSFSHFSRTRRVPFVTCFHLGFFFLKTCFIDSLLWKRLNFRLSWTLWWAFYCKTGPLLCSRLSASPFDRFLIKSLLIKGAPFKTYTLLTFDFHSANTLQHNTSSVSSAVVSNPVPTSQQCRKCFCSCSFYSCIIAVFRGMGGG